MRFEGSRIIAAPESAVWYALRNPDVLEVLIPHCSRIERQPGYRPESDADFTLSFELDVPQKSGHTGLIIGWLEVDRQRPPHHLSLTLTLNDALVFMHAEGTIDLTAREHGHATEIHYAVEAKVPGMRGVGWSASVHEEAEDLVGAMLDELARWLVHAGVATTATTTNGHAPAASPQVMLATPRGSVILLPATEVPAPTQGMLRRVTFNRARRVARQQRSIISAATMSVVAFASAAYVVWEWRRRTSKV
jgi:carbon monoxide dehydrogenase subunit G